MFFDPKKLLKYLFFIKNFDLRFFRYFDHRSTYPASSIAALGRFKKFLNWQNIEDQGIDG